VSALITYAVGLVKGMTGNAYFPTPTPPPATVQTAITDLQTADTAAQTRAKGVAALRNEKQQALLTLLEQTPHLRVVDGRREPGERAVDHPERRDGLAQGARPQGAWLPAKLGSVSGSLKVVAPAAARRASYEWQYSIDGGKTWVTMPSTLN
jgi:hypothetical protein